MADEPETFLTATLLLFGTGFENKMKDGSESLRILYTMKDRKGSSPRKKFFLAEPLFCPLKKQWQCTKRKAVVEQGQRSCSPQTVTSGKNQPELVEILHSVTTCSTKTTKTVLSSTVNLLVQRGINSELA